MRPGSCDRAAEVAVSALIKAGATTLQARLGRHIASRGVECWETDAAVREQIAKESGRYYHRESIGRGRRDMTRRGWIGSRRIFPQQKLPNGHRCAQGTTTKYIDWGKFGVRNPLTRGERREARQKQKRADYVAELEPRRRHAAIPLEPAFVALVDGIGQAPAPSTRARRQRPVERQRLSQAELQDRAAEARSAIEQWSRDNEERGPP